MPGKQQNIPYYAVFKTQTSKFICKSKVIIKKLETEMSVVSVCDEYGVKKRTVSDIKITNKDKLVKYAVSECVDCESSKSGKVGNRKHIKMGKDQSLDAVVKKWYVQQRSNGVYVRGVEIMAAAAKLATHLNFTDFKGSDG